METLFNKLVQFAGLQNRSQSQAVVMRQVVVLVLAVVWGRIVADAYLPAGIWWLPSEFPKVTYSQGGVSDGLGRVLELEELVR